MEELNIKLKLFDVMCRPYEHEHGDWIDLRSRESIHVSAGNCYVIPLGVAMELPNGYEALVLPRSSTFKNYGLIMVNSSSVIDNSYSGPNDEWYFIGYCPSGHHTINRGDRICQFRVQKRQPILNFELSDLEGNKNRGGIGSTGRS